MSSSTVTIKARRRTAQYPPPNSVSTSQNKGTILLRNPLPKYNFESKSKTKKDESFHLSENKGGKNESEENDSKKVNKSKEAVKVEVASPQASVVEPLPVCRLVESFPQSFRLPDSNIDTPLVNKADNTEPCLKDKPVNKVGPINKLTGKKLTHSVSDSVINVQNELENNTHSQPHIILEQSTDTTQTGNQTGSARFVDENQQTGSVNTSEISPTDLTGTQFHRSCNCSEKVKQLQEEKQLLKNQLEVQLQVNQELKKLLVASVGDDLEHRVEKLMRDKAQLSMEIGDYNKKITDDYEHLDKISIQADMWRSKFLASRVMTDELASSRAFYMMQFQECQMAIQKLLNERHQLRCNLYDTYRGLTQIQEAFDPLGSLTTGPRLLTSKNTIDLARTNQHLVETIKYRLLPSHVTTAMSSKMETDWHDYLTPAEAHAQQLLTREMRPEDFSCLIPARSIMAAPGSMSVDRYHPCANYDNLTLNVCCKCKGEISII